MSKKLTANSGSAEAFALCGIELLMSLPPAVSQSSLKLIADLAIKGAAGRQCDQHGTCMQVLKH